MVENIYIRKYEHRAWLLRLSFPLDATSPPLPLTLHSCPFPSPLKPFVRDFIVLPAYMEYSVEWNERRIMVFRFELKLYKSESDKRQQGLANELRVGEKRGEGMDVFFFGVKTPFNSS